ncbi:MAG: Sua5/YciO/YrdC/YwlC family protein [Planctomycetes bacterium]|nr:Sua5/YciO/YrdC/YwlC family protein [Planctomycetota bacterium]MCW8134912.1 Sua5/YciO/YrdC/YwlC family protein [Planctomycetota bacterium]
MPARVLQPDQLELAAQLIREGALVGFPTDTVYGVAAAADVAFGNDKLKAFKGGRSEGFSLHAGSVDTAIRTAGPLLPAEEFAVRALTPNGATVVVARKDTGLGVRVVQHPLGSRLLELAGLPVIATSANEHGQPPLRDPARIAQMPLDAVLDGGELPERPASSVVRLLPSGLEILRMGAASRDKLAQMFTRPVHFVCLGNLNRSAFAHRLIEAMQNWLMRQVRDFVPAYAPSSSGLIARAERRSPPDMQQTAMRYNASLASHTPQVFDPDVLPPLCVSMGDDVVAEVQEFAAGEVLQWQIDDPMGKPPGVYARAARQVIEAMRRDLLARWAGNTEMQRQFNALFCGEGETP